MGSRGLQPLLLFLRHYKMKQRLISEGILGGEMHCGGSNKALRWFKQSIAMVQTKHCGEKIKEYDWLVCNMRIAVLQYANCFLRFAFFLSIRYSVVSCVGCFICDSKKTTDLIRINLSFCVIYIGRSNCNVLGIYFKYSFKSVYLQK